MGRVSVFVFIALTISVTLIKVPSYANAKVLLSTKLDEWDGNYNAREFDNLIAYLTPIVNNVTGDNCRKELGKFLQALQNSSLWAVEMFDATSKIPIGLVTGNTFQFGNYDQCVEVLAPQDEIKGKYCLADVQFAPNRKKYPPFYRSHVENEFSLYYDPYGPVWEKMKVTRDPTKKRRDKFQTGICVPNACSADDTKNILMGISSDLIHKYGFDINITVDEKLCSNNEPKDFHTGAKILSGVVVFFVVAVFICSLWDVSRKPKENESLSQLQTLMVSFSLKNNMSKLTAPDWNTDMDVFHGMKTLSMILIILGHRAMNSYGGPFFNPQFLERRYRRFEDMFLLNGTLIVDTFFLTSGYITFIGLFTTHEAKKKVSSMEVYLYRWLRITPVYMIIVFFYAYLLEHLGSGPVWGLKVGREAARCRENWWSNLLYINNYVNTDELCMFQSWYVTCDMHFTLLAPIIVKTMVDSRRRGFRLLGFLIALSVLIPFTITFTQKYDGVLRVYMSIFEDLAKSFTFTQVYIRTHNRATPYFIGMAAAYLHLYLKRTRYPFTVLQVVTLSLLAAVFALSSLLGAWLFYIPGRGYDALENALYASFHRVFWALGMGWIAISGSRRGFGIIQPLLAKKIYIPLSRLSFGAFLVHGAVQMYTTATLRTPEYMCFTKLFWMTAGDVVMSFTFAFLVHVFLEAPIGGIQKLLLSFKKTRPKGKDSPSNTQKNENKHLETGNGLSQGSLISRAEKEKIS